MKKKKELTEASKDELLSLREEYKEQLRKLKFEHAIKPLDNPKQLKNLRKTIARINTLLREYELGIRKEVK
jgi:large subunit ribosomal protein L29